MGKKRIDGKYAATEVKKNKKTVKLKDSKLHSRVGRKEV